MTPLVDGRRGGEAPVISCKPEIPDVGWRIGRHVAQQNN
jgi:hypothetical protein